MGDSVYKEGFLIKEGMEGTLLAPEFLLTSALCGRSYHAQLETTLVHTTRTLPDLLCLENGMFWMNSHPGLL